MLIASALLVLSFQLAPAFAGKVPASSKGLQIDVNFEIEAEWRDPETRGRAFEGDILEIPASDAGINAPSHSGERDENRRWPGGRIPYVIKSDFDSTRRDKILTAMQKIEETTCIRFTPRNGERNYIEIQNDQDGCFSHVGDIHQGRQTVNLDHGCFQDGFPAIVAHKLIHTIGFNHEQSRSDRDDYVYVNKKNIIPGIFESNFQKYSSARITDFGLPYDYDSIMHYGETFFARNQGEKTIWAKKPGIKIGQRKHLSKLDVEKINRMYKCNKVQPSTTTTSAPSTFDPTAPYWKRYTRKTFTDLPPKAVFAGTDKGKSVYVARASYNGDWVPGKFVHDKSSTQTVFDMFITHDEKELSLDVFEILVDPSNNLAWALPPVDFATAVLSGGKETGTDEHLLIGRGRVEGAWVVGKVLESSNSLFAPWQGSEFATNDYEILVFKPDTFSSSPPTTTTTTTATTTTTRVTSTPVPSPVSVPTVVPPYWKKFSRKLYLEIPPQAVFVGRGSDASVYVCRAMYNGQWIPGKFLHYGSGSQKMSDAFISYGEKEIQVDNFELLVDPSHSLEWVEFGPTADGGKAVISDGKETTTGENLLFGRAQIGADWVAGRVVPSRNILYYALYGHELEMYKFEILRFKTQPASFYSASPEKKVSSNLMKVW